jgi:tetratricopeptide (TPR) repeat protein
MKDKWLNKWFMINCFKTSCPSFTSTVSKTYLSMKARTLLLILIAEVAIITFTAFRGKYVQLDSMFTQQPVSTPSISDEGVSCGPAEEITSDLDKTGRKMVALPGWGTHSWKITTTSDSAQYYFDQGLNLLYSFHLGESRASFQEAQRHDPACAMAYWGETMTNSPYINNTGYHFSDSLSIAVIQKAKDLATVPLEQAVIQAQQVRFTTNEQADRRELAKAYQDAMQAVYEQNPDNIEVATLYADARMIMDARNWYTQQGEPKAGTDDIIRLLEQILEKNPAHPAALHYYIHIVEPSHTPERATEEADKLLGLLPSVAHMVHMPSHIYVRTGDYKKGVVSNERAIAGYGEYMKTIRNGWEGSRPLYLYHNADMQGTSALMMGNYKAAKRAFDQNVKRFNIQDTAMYAQQGFGEYLQFATVQSYLLNIRFGKWKQVLESKAPVSPHTYHTLLWQFGQGMALAKTNDLPGATAALQAMTEKMKDTLLMARMHTRSRPYDVAVVAKTLLEGTIALAQNKKQEAIQLYSAAVEAEDTLRYAEPESWRLPARHYLGHVYLLEGDFSKAQQTFEQDLLDHPNNFWAVNGLRNALKKQNKPEAVKQLEKKYANVFAEADVKLPGAVY